ncbi:MAG: hypothetical protein GWP15_00775 [Nitrospirae bacterium]|nr:hypothetical protein [Nitrospirota bacterium]
MSLSEGGQPGHMFALEATEIWHENNNPKGIPDNLQDRLAQAEIFCRYPLDQKQRSVLAWTIRNAFKAEIPSFLEKHAGFNNGLLVHLKAFEKGENITLADVNNYINLFFQTAEAEEILNPESGVTQAIADIKHSTYQALKVIIEYELSDTTKAVEDKVFDANRSTDFKEATENGLKKIRKLLSRVSGYKGTKMTCVDLNPYKHEPIVFSEGKTSNVDFETLEWKTHEHVLKMPEEEVNFSYAISESKDSSQTSVIFKLSFQEQNLGYIEYCFEGGYVHDVILRMCASVTGEVDSFVDTRLQRKLNDDIEEKRKEIFSRNEDIVEWRNMCTDCCEMLAKILKRPIGFSCKRFDEDNDEEWGSQIYKAGDEIKAEVLNLEKQPMEGVITNGEYFPITLEFDGIRQVQFGSLRVECKNYAERRIINKIIGALTEFLKIREERRYAYTKAIGLRMANLFLDQNIERLQKLKFGILFADLVGFSKVTKEIEIKARNKGIDQNVIAEVVDGLYTDIIAELEKEFDITIDKVVGDMIIGIYAKLKKGDGKIEDIEEHKGIDVCKAFETLYEVSSGAQSGFSNVAEKVVEKVKIELKEKLGENYDEQVIEEIFNPVKDLKFSNTISTIQALLGMFGDPKNRKSRLNFTGIGDEVNLAARILNEAGAGEVLVWKKSWDEYGKKGGDKLVAVGEPFLIEAKNIGLVEVVFIEKAEERDKRRSAQRQLISELDNRHGERKASEKKHLFNSSNLDGLSDGIYIDTPDKVIGEEVYDTSLTFEGTEGITVSIPSGQVRPVKHYVTPQQYFALKEEGKTTELHKESDKFRKITYVNIEDLVAKRIRELFSDRALNNHRIRLEELIEIEGEWEYHSRTETKEDLYEYTLSRAGQIVRVVINNNNETLSEGPPEKDDKTLICEDNKITFKKTRPSWLKPGSSCVSN